MSGHYRRPSSDTERVAALEWLVHGTPGNPGALMRLDLRQSSIEARQTATETRVQALETMIDRGKWLFTMVCKVARWAAVVIAFLVLTVAPDDLADKLTKAAGAIKTVMGLGGL